MPKIITFGREPIELEQKLEKQNPLDYLKSIFNSFDRFTKIQVITVILLIILAPFFVVSNFVFNTRASITPEVGSPIIETPLAGGANIKTSQTSLTTQTFQATQLAASQNYNVDLEVLNVVTLINQFRAQNGLSALRPTLHLSDAAKWMSNDMAQKNYMSHYDSVKMVSQSKYTCDTTGTTCCSLTNTSLTSNAGKCVNKGFFCQGTCAGRLLGARLKYFSYNSAYAWTGENLGSGFVTSQDIVTAWKNSPAHRTVLLGTNYNAIGINRAYNQSSTYGWYWAADLGTINDTSGNPLDTAVSYVAQLTPTPTPYCLLNCATPTLTKAPTPTPTRSPYATPTPTRAPTPTPGGTGCLGPNGVTFQVGGQYCSGDSYPGNGATQSSGVVCAAPVTANYYTCSSTGSWVLSACQSSYSCGYYNSSDVGCFSVCSSTTVTPTTAPYATPTPTRAPTPTPTPVSTGVCLGPNGVMFQVGEQYCYADSYPGNGQIVGSVVCSGPATINYRTCQSNGTFSSLNCGIINGAQAYCGYYNSKDVGCFTACF